MIGIEASDYPHEPLTLIGYQLKQSALQLIFHSLERGLHTIAPCPPKNVEAAGTIRASDHCEPQIVQSFQFAKSTFLSDQTRKAIEPK